MVSKRETLAAIRATGLRAAFIAETNEFQVGAGNAAYFTDDPEDAVGTARAMAADMKAQGWEPAPRKTR